MNKEQVLTASKRIFLAACAVLTVLFFFDIKFVVAGLNIIEWDVIAFIIWAFVSLCIWAKRENTLKRALAVAAVTILSGFMLTSALFALAIGGGLPKYVEGTEPQTHRTFVVEYQTNLLLRGTANVYERFGPMLISCGLNEYAGEPGSASMSGDCVYLSEDGTCICVAFFFGEPFFTIPLD